MKIKYKLLPDEDSSAGMIEKVPDSMIVDFIEHMSTVENFSDDIDVEYEIYFENGRERERELLSVFSEQDDVYFCCLVDNYIVINDIKDLYVDFLCKACNIKQRSNDYWINYSTDVLDVLNDAVKNDTIDTSILREMLFDDIEELERCIAVFEV